MKIINIDVKDEIILNNMEDVDTGEITGISSTLTVPTGNYNNIILNFNFENDKLCEDLNMFANFSIVTGASIDVELSKIVAKEKECKYACYIPTEVFEKECDFYLGVYGYALNEDETLKQRVSFEAVRNIVIRGTYDPEATEGLLPSPSVFEVYFQQVKDINEQIANEYQGIIDRLEEIKEEHINDFNEKIEPEKQNAINDFDAHADEKLEEVKEDIDKHFEENASSYEEGINDNTVRIKRLESNIFDSGEASGTSINIKDSTLAEFQEIVVDGVCKQEATTGKNILDLSKCNFFNCILNEDGSITSNIDNTHYCYIEVTKLNEFFMNNLGKTITFSTGTAIANRLTSILINGTRSDGKTNQESSETGTGKCTLTISENFTKITNIQLRFNRNSSGAFTDKATTVKYAQLEVGENATEFEPYTGGQPSPSPDYPQEIEVVEGTAQNKFVGKNLFDKDNANTLNAIINGTTKLITSFDTCKSIYVKCEKNTNYTISRKVGTRFVAGTTTNVPIAGTTCNHAIADNTANSITITTTENDNYLVVFYYNSGTDTLTEEEIRNSIQIEKGNIATDCEPYQENTLDVNLQGNFIGKIKTITDTLRVENGLAILNKKIGKIVLNGSENWSYSSTAGGFTLSNVFKTLTPHALSTHFVCQGSYTTWTGYGNFGFNQDGVIWFQTETKFSSVNEWKNWLQANPITVYYILAESYEVELGEVDVPLSYYPETNVVTLHELSPNIKVKYYRDIKNTITNIQLDIETLKQAVATMTVNQANPTNELDLLQEPSESESEE